MVSQTLVREERLSSEHHCPRSALPSGGKGFRGLKKGSSSSVYLKDHFSFFNHVFKLKDCQEDSIGFASLFPSGVYFFPVTFKSARDIIFVETCDGHFFRVTGTFLKIVTGTFFEILPRVEKNNHHRKVILNV